VSIQLDRVLDGMLGLSVIKARWLYSSQEPMVLVMQVYSVHGPVTWVIGRDLLRDALATGRGGDEVYGDVLAEVDQETNSMILSLTTPTGHCMLAFDSSAVQELVEATTHVVPIGAEFVMFDWGRWQREATA